MKFFAQATVAPSLPSPPPIADWGVALVVLYLVGKELWNLFKTKDESETQLTNSLIQDLRTTNKTYLESQNDKLDNLIVIQSREASGIEKLDKSIREMMLTYQMEAQTLKRDNVGFIIETRQQLTLMDAKLDALHRRLDAAGIGSRKEDRGNGL